MARKHKTGCHPSGIKRNGRLRKGFRWARGRSHCAIPARKGAARRRRRRR